MTSPVDLVVVAELVVVAFVPAARGPRTACCAGTARAGRPADLGDEVYPHGWRLQGAVRLAAPSVRTKQNFKYGESAQPRTYLLAAKTELAD